MQRGNDRKWSAMTCRWLCRLIVFLCVSFFSTASVARQVEQPQALKMRLSRIGLRFDMKIDEEERLLKDTGERSYYQSEVLNPSLTARVNGSIFHPNLLTFGLGGEYGLSIEDRETDDPTLSSAGGSLEVLSYDASVSLLQAKPYPMRIYASKGRARQEYDLFTRVTIERSSIGTQLRFLNAFAPVILDWERWREETLDEISIDARQESRISFRATNSRKNSEKTDLKFLFEEFDQQFGGGLPFSGITHVSDLVDVRALNPAKKTRLTSSLSYRVIDSEDTETSTLLAREEYSTQPTKSTSVRAYCLYDHQSQNESQIDRYETQAVLNHQLYASLGSAMVIDMARYEVSGAGADDSGLSYGVSLSEDYDKKLGDWGKLSVDISARRSRQERASSTATTRVIRESVALVDGQTSLLASPDIDIGSVEVTDSTGTRIYSINTDYVLLQRGDFTEIRRQFGGNIPQGSTVRASYLASADADVSLSGSHNRGRVGLDFMDNRCNVFAEIGTTAYSGEGSLAFQDVDDRRIGASYGHEWFSLGVSRQVYESDSVAYESLNSYQRINFNVLSSGVLALEGTQSRTTYEGEQYEQSINTYFLRYSHNISRSCSIGGMLGSREEVVNSVERDATTAEGTLRYSIGLLELELSHWVSEDSTASENTRKHRTVVRIERRFW